MRHLLEAIVRIEGAELDIPFITSMDGAAGGGDIELRRSRNAFNALRDIARMELDTLLATRNDIANINPLEQQAIPEFYHTLTRGILDAQAAREFGTDAPASVNMAWFCTNEESHRIAPGDVQTGAPENDGQSILEVGHGLVGYCPHHAIYEVVELRETDETEEVEEAEVWIGGADQRFRIIRVAAWVDDLHMNITGNHMNVGDEGRILWDERIMDPNRGLRVPGWFVQLDSGFEMTLPRDIMGAPRR